MAENEFAFFFKREEIYEMKTPASQKIEIQKVSISYLPHKYIYKNLMVKCIKNL